MSGRLARWWMLPALVVGVLAVVASPADGQGDDDITAEPVDSTEGLPIDVVPNGGDTRVAVPPSSPTAVEIRIDVEQILAINERDSRFEVDAVLTARWFDKRGLDECTSRQVHHGGSAAEMLKMTRWSPAFVVVDGRGPRQTTALEVSVSCEGIVRYEERFTVAVTQRFTDLNDFPVDDHDIRFQVAPFGRAGQEAIRFEALDGDDNCESSLQKSADKFEAEEWEFTALPCVIVASPPSITTWMRIDRLSRYYWMNIVAPLVLIVSISWIVFWMKPVLHERLGVSITVLLTVVAFDFLTGDSLPKLSFTTRIDQFYNASYLFVALTIVASFFATRRRTGVSFERIADGDERTDDEHDTSERDADEVGTIDRFSRYAFPPSYALVVILVVGFGVASPGRGEVTSERRVPPEREVTTTTLGGVATTTLGGVTTTTLGGDNDEGTDAVIELTDERPERSGTISEPGEQFEYRVCGFADEVRSLRMQRQPLGEDESLDPVLDLYAEDGTLVTFDDDGAGGFDSLIVLPRADACYALVASDVTGEGTGHYALTLSIGEAEAAGVDVAAQFGDVDERFGVSFDRLNEEPTKLDPGDELSESIDEPGQVRPYYVCSDDVSGGYVTMKWATRLIDGGFDPLLVLYDGNGGFVAVDDDGAGGLDSQLVLPTSDDCYVLVASEVSMQAIGKFTLSFEAGEPAVVDDALSAEFDEAELLFGAGFEQLLIDAVELRPDEVLRESIDEPGEVDSYRVCSQSDDVLVSVMRRLRVTPESQLDPWLALVSVDGLLLRVDDDSAGNFGSRIALPWGNDCHLLLAGDVRGAFTGEYALTTMTE